MSDTRIAGLHGRRVWDSRGRPTVEAEVRLRGGAIGRAIAPAGASTGSGEAIELRDGGTRLGGRDVQHAVAAVNGEIAAALQGHDAADQSAIDRLLIALDGTPQKRRLGGNALVAVSMAALHAAEHVDQEAGRVDALDEVMKVAAAQARQIEKIKPPHQLSRISAKARGHTSLYDTLQLHAKSARLRLDADKRRDATVFRWPKIASR